MLLSTVRSHANQHTSNSERLCVALTRAKRHLVVFGAGAKMTNNRLWKAVVEASTQIEHVNLLCSVVANSPCQLEKQPDAAVLEAAPSSSVVLVDDDDLYDDEDDEGE